MFDLYEISRTTSKVQSNYEKFSIRLNLCKWSFNCKNYEKHSKLLIGVRKIKIHIWNALKITYKLGKHDLFLGFLREQKAKRAMIVLRFFTVILYYCLLLYYISAENFMRKPWSYKKEWTIVKFYWCLNLVWWL